MQATIRGALRRGAAGSAAILIAGTSMWLSTAPTLAKGQDAKSTSASDGQSNHDGSADSNRGDVWTDNVGQPSGPGHEQDTHLSCSNINLWGAGMGDSSGTYAIDSWPPSGNQAVVYNSTWHYNQAQGGSQVISVIDVKTLVANAQAAGAAPQNKSGYHFKLDLTQDPQKHKTFWVNCPAAAPSGAGNGGTLGHVRNGGGTAGTSTGRPTSTGGDTEAVTPPASGVEGVTTNTPSSGAAPAHTSTNSSPAATVVHAVQGVLGAATTMPVTGRAAVAGGLLLAVAMVLMGAFVVRRARTIS